MITSIPGAVDGTTLSVREIPTDEHDFATSDGRYFCEASTLLTQMHDLLHDLLPQCTEQGYDEESFSDACHVLLNMVQDAGERLGAYIVTMLVLEGLPVGDDPFSGIDVAAMLSDD